MPVKLNKEELIKLILKNADNDLQLEEMMKLLLQEKVSKHPDENEIKPTFGMRAADAVAKFAGSWTFIIIFVVAIASWMLINIVFLLKPFDPYPFILLNLILSCVAALQAPVIMMSQNRQEKKDRERATSDYMVNLKTELIIEDIYNKIDKILIKLEEREKK